MLPGGGMPSNSDYAQKQFLTDKSDRAERDRMARELRALRGKVRELEDKVSSLTCELAQRKVLGTPPRGFS